VQRPTAIFVALPHRGGSTQEATVAIPASTTTSCGNSSSAGATDHRRGSAQLVVCASALVCLVASTVLAAAVAGLLGGPGSGQASTTATIAEPAPRDENRGDSRHGPTAEDDQRRSQESAAATQPSSTWRFTGMTAAAKAAVESDLILAVPAVRPLLGRLAPAVSVDAATSECRAGALSCSYRDQGIDGRWGIHLDAQTTSATYPSNRFIVYHEIGHAVWGCSSTTATDMRSPRTYGLRWTDDRASTGEAAHAPPSRRSSPTSSRGTPAGSGCR
jgi:hypothetical protein